jgi:hypothetical protein
MAAHLLCSAIDNTCDAQDADFSVDVVFYAADCDEHGIALGNGKCGAVTLNCVINV